MLYFKHIWNSFVLIGFGFASLITGFWPPTAFRTLKTATFLGLDCETNGTYLTVSSCCFYFSPVNLMFATSEETTFPMLNLRFPLILTCTFSLWITLPCSLHPPFSLIYWHLEYLDRLLTSVIDLSCSILLLVGFKLEQGCTTAMNEDGFDFGLMQDWQGWPIL